MPKEDIAFKKEVIRLGIHFTTGTKKTRRKCNSRFIMWKENKTTN